MTVVGLSVLLSAVDFLFFARFFMLGWISSFLVKKKLRETIVPELVLSEIRSFDEYTQYVYENNEINFARSTFQKNIIPRDKAKFTLDGYCYVCKKYTNFLVDFDYSYMHDGVLTPNWRERLVCPGCGLSNRQRASVNIFGDICKSASGSSIYITEQRTKLYKIFRKLFPRVRGSEYLGCSVDCGACDRSGIRNEDLTRLSFDDGEFDYILSFDVFEHIPEYKKAFAECLRCLKLGGMLLFSVPFVKTVRENIVRSCLSSNGDVIHLLPPEYHGDPVRSDGCLCFYHFGWEILDELRAVGFSDAKALFYWSRELGHLGSEQVMFVATKEIQRGNGQKPTT